MGRLVDTDVLLKSKTILWDPALGFCECVLVDDIEKAPAAVVLCEDCKNWRKSGNGCGYCEAWGEGRFHDSFCNYGEIRNADA